MLATCHRVNAGQLSCKIGLGAGEYETCNKYPVPIDAQLTKNFVMVGPLSRPPKNTASRSERDTGYSGGDCPVPWESWPSAVFMGGRDNGPAMTMVEIGDSGLVRQN